MELNSIDRSMMARCTQLARQATAEGELPFGSLIARNGTVLAEATNQIKRRADESRHAEIIAIAQARQLLGTNKLDDCTLYCTVEPCPMCSFCIRSARIGRVVYALHSPVMGGASRWNILRDDTLSDKLPFLFRPAPDVVTGVLADEVEQAWSEWNPLVWKLIKLGRFLSVPENASAHASGGYRRSLPGRAIASLFMRL